VLDPVPGEVHRGDDLDGDRADTDLAGSHETVGRIADIGEEAPERELVGTHRRARHVVVLPEPGDPPLEVCGRPGPREAAGCSCEASDDPSARVDAREGEVARELLVAPAEEHLLEERTRLITGVVAWSERFEAHPASLHLVKWVRCKSQASTAGKVVDLLVRGTFRDPSSTD
jgi:hypothetical protein